MSSERVPKFAPASDFSRELTEAVQAYFRARGLSDKANAAMVVKTIAVLVWTASSYALIIAPGVSLFVRWLGCVGLGIGYAGLGMAIGHDAIHGAYSHRPWVNQLLSLAFDVMGASSHIWRYTHNITHHTYVNLAGIDLDVNYEPVMRLAPWTPRRRIHRYQAFYAFLLYSLAGLYWLYVKDIVRFRSRSFGPYRDLRHSRAAWAGLLLGRLFVLSYTIALPIYLLRPSLGQFIVGYLTTMLLAGILMALVFLLAHAVEGPEMPTAPQSGRMDDPFFEHQLRTTADFACENHLLSWLVGGLNFQVEHHLFPHVCSVHYPALRPLVRTMAKKYGLPCHEFPSWWSALCSHVAHLQRLGAAPAPAPASEEDRLPALAPAQRPTP